MKKIISFILIFLIILTSAVFAYTFEGNGTNGTNGANGTNGVNEADFDPANQIPAGYDDDDYYDYYAVPAFMQTVFTDEPIRLSLDDAIDRMLSQGAPIEQANLMLLADRARTRSHFDDVNIINSLRGAPPMPTGIPVGMRPSRTREEMAQHAYEFAQVQADRNFDAAVNAIRRDVIMHYYNLAHAKENLRISLDNVATQELLYRNVQSRFSLGVASRQEVLQAELGLAQARVDAESNENTLAQARMAFNFAFGFDLLQNVILTDTLEEVTISGISLQNAIYRALENRNEIHGAVFDVGHFELLRRETGNTVARSSGTYRSVVAGQRAAQAAYDNFPKQIEMEIRNKYINMTQRQSDIAIGRLKVANAREAFRLANLQYDLGMTTIAETHAALLAVYNAELFLNMALLQYNLAIVDFEMATTVGTTRIPL